MWTKFIFLDHFCFELGLFLGWFDFSILFLFDASLRISTKIIHSSWLRSTYLTLKLALFTVGVFGDAGRDSLVTSSSELDTSHGDRYAKEVVRTGFSFFLLERAPASSVSSLPIVLLNDSSLASRYKFTILVWLGLSLLMKSTIRLTRFLILQTCFLLKELSHFSLGLAVDLPRMHSCSASVWNRTWSSDSEFELEQLTQLNVVRPWWTFEFGFHFFEVHVHLGHL